MKTSVLILLALSVTLSCFGQNTWTKKGNFPGGKRYGASSAVVNDKAYVGLGDNGYIDFKDWWQYDSTTDQWIAKTSFPGIARYVGTAITIDGIVYVGLGATGSSDILSDWWAYRPATDTWVQKSSLPSDGRYGVSSFVVNGKGYICLGNIGTAFGPFSNQLWQYDPLTDTWTQKANFPGFHRYGGIGFSIGNKGYVGLGGKKNQGYVYKYYNDLWEYDPTTDSWTEKATYPQKRNYPAVFVIGSKAYVGLGHNNSGYFSTFFAYDPVSDSWSPAAPFPGTPREVLFGFAVNGKGYVGTGYNSGTFLDDVWELGTSGGFAEKASGKHEQECILKTTSIGNSIQFHLSGEYDFSDAQLELFDMGGALRHSQNFSEKSILQLNGDIPKGIYIAVVTMNDFQSCSQKILVQ